MKPVLEWAHSVSEVAEGGLEVRRTATAAECAAVALALGILGCEKLEASYRIEPLPGGCYRVRGRITGALVQACVVTLDPVVQRLDEPLDVEFRPKGRIADLGEGEQEALGPEDPEPIENNRLSVGRVTYEIVAAALEPYPRAPEARLEDSEAVAAPKESQANPFAALARLKPKTP